MRAVMAITMASFLLTPITEAQVRLGAASYAPAPPFHKAKTQAGGPGFNATAMLTREIFADELPAANEGGLDVPGRPLPTNDWWTDLINSRFSGALWSYPAMLHTSDEGVKIDFPSYWADSCKEIKSRSSITVGGNKFHAASAIAADWHDWDVRFRLPSASAVSRGEITATSVHGSPFTWFEFTQVAPQLRCSATPVFFGKGNSYTGVKIGNDLYAIYYPTGCVPAISDGQISFPEDTEWLAVALLRDESDLTLFAPYASSIPRSTSVAWKYDESTSKVESVWRVKADNLRKPGGDAPVLQGFLPHVYKYTLPGSSLSFIDEKGFMTPRGSLLLSASPSGEFAYAYRFSGMLPTYAAPKVPEENSENPFREDVLRKLMSDYAAKGSFGADTYWGGKGLLQMALNMSFAKESGETEIYEASRKALREALADWLTYTPGEDTRFFSYYPRWGAMLGFDVSYDSDAFNDHHFHYGYFTYAAALLCMEDAEFARDYGEMLTLIAKDYANWDRNDRRFPFMRTLDPWNGHSWAGGLGDAGNDNGNGQESTSEAMQSWGGLYLLGVALDNKEMRDAGIWGWSTEARATREYWYDVDAPRPANAGGRKPWAGKGNLKGNYDYNEYPYAYNSNITGKGIGWWTWFGGDPLFMHGIQWMPVSPALDYLSWDPDFTAWAFDDMMSGANSTYSHSWFEETSNSDNGERIEPLAHNDWGNVALTYLERSNPREAARVFDEALSRGNHIATSVSTSHISYYVVHSHLTYGDPDFTIHSDMPTAQVRRRADGQTSYIVYNPDETDREVRFLNESGAVVKQVTAPARRLAAINADPKASEIEFKSAKGVVIPPGETTLLSWRTLDQYGAGMKGRMATATLSEGSGATLSADGNLKVEATASKGSRFTLTLADGDLSKRIDFEINDRPEPSSVSIIGVPSVMEKGADINAQLKVTDQYGAAMDASDAQWRAESLDGASNSEASPKLTFPSAGRYRVSASSASTGAKAETEVFVMPPMPLVSLDAGTMASSAENVGTLPEGATDASSDSRWGSQHADGEWLVVDLGENTLLSRAEIIWEAAYASRYELQTAPDGCDMMELDVNYAGQNRKISVPVESSWTTVATEQISSPGKKTTNLLTEGRYVRVRGLERATGYGISLYDIGLYGLRSSLPDDAVVGVDFSLPEMTDRGTTVPLKPRVFMRSGDLKKDVDVEWSSDLPARFDGDSFTPLENGFYTVKAGCDKGSGSSARIFVNDVERVASIGLSSKELKTAEGMPLEIRYTVMNQFMAPYSGDIDDIGITVTDSEGNVTDKATYNPSTMIFLAHATGVYTVDFNGMAECKVNVLPFSDINLALLRPGEASSSKDNNRPALALDGNPDTRWESEWSEPHTFTVDLEGVYRINRVAILWEGAYAKSYRIETSMDGTSWNQVVANSDCKGDYDSQPFPSVDARYVRICLDKRALPAYGFSIKEFEVYGESVVTGIEDLIYDSTVGESWFTLQGLPVARPTLPGLYIRLTNGKACKVMLK